MRIKTCTFLISWCMVKCRIFRFLFLIFHDLKDLILQSINFIQKKIIFLMKSRKIQYQTLYDFIPLQYKFIAQYFENCKSKSTLNTFWQINFVLIKKLLQKKERARQVFVLFSSQYSYLAQMILHLKKFIFIRVKKKGILGAFISTWCALFTFLWKRVFVRDFTYFWNLVNDCFLLKYRSCTVNCV